MRELCELIERYADPNHPRDKQQLTRAIHGLSYAARNLSDKHNGRAVRESFTDWDATDIKP